MDDRQRAFLDRIAAWIPRLIDEVARGNASSEITLGVRVVKGERLRLFLRVERMDSGRNPLQTHGQQPIQASEEMEIVVSTRRRRQPRRQAKTFKR